MFINRKLYMTIYSICYREKYINTYIPTLSNQPKNSSECVLIKPKTAVHNKKNC